MHTCAQGAQARLKLAQARLKLARARDQSPVFVYRTGFHSPGAPAMPLPAEAMAAWSDLGYHHGHDNSAGHDQDHVDHDDRIDYADRVDSQKEHECHVLAEDPEEDQESQPKEDCNRDEVAHVDQEDEVEDQEEDQSAARRDQDEEGQAEDMTGPGGGPGGDGGSESHCLDISFRKHPASGQ
eukprot:7036097-Pyramimonas_sp.AAC.1